MRQPAQPLSLGNRGPKCWERQMGVIASYELGDFDSMEAHLDRAQCSLARQLGARRFEAQGLECKAACFSIRDAALRPRQRCRDS